MKLNRVSKQLLSVALVMMSLGSTSVWAEIAVIVHPSNSSQLEQKEIKRIFMGKKTSFPDGSSARPISQSDNSLIAVSFNKKIMKKSSSELTRYWSRAMFSGNANPPIKVVGDDEVKKMVSEEARYIGYIDVTNVDDSVRVLLTF